MQRFSEVSVVSEKVFVVLRSRLIKSLEDQAEAMSGEGWRKESPLRFVSLDRVWEITLSRTESNKYPTYKSNGSSHGIYMALSGF